MNARETATAEAEERRGSQNLTLVNDGSEAVDLIHLDDGEAAQDAGLVSTD